jgi:hypothetical protein
MNASLEMRARVLTPSELIPQVSGPVGAADPSEPLLSVGWSEVNQWVGLTPELTRRITLAARGAREPVLQVPWGEVEGWVSLFVRRIQGRTKLGLDRLLHDRRDVIRRCGLQRGEVLATHLYTGPAFLPYNSLYRSFPPHMVDLLQGDKGASTNRRNTLSTTLFSISSALVKLGRHTPLPEHGKVYRGLGRMVLPLEFWAAHGQPPWKGGVERAIMSTTTDKDVAIGYTGGKGVVVEIGIGRIQIGGDVGWASMVRPLRVSLTSLRSLADAPAPSRLNRLILRIQSSGPGLPLLV